MDVHKALKTIPQTPGVYIYRDKKHTVIYVGKGVNLSRRVHQYFSPHAKRCGEEKTRLLVSQIMDIETIPTLTEFDALLLEAKLIKQFLPKYNVIARDDKSPLYVQLTLEEELPRVLFVRRPHRSMRTFQGYKMAKNIEVCEPSIIFGPFQSAFVTRNLLRSLRRIVPYCTQKQRNGRPCFYTHLGLCNPCPSVIAKLPEGEEKRVLTREYRKNMFRLRDILLGKGISIITELTKEMKQASNTNDFEKATSLRNQLVGLSEILQKHYDPSFYVEGAGAEDIFEKEQQELNSAFSSVYPLRTKLNRIECIDISNLGGKQAVGSMVVLINGQPDRSQYRKFKIRMENTPNDVAMIAEVVNRRLNHKEWTYPNLLVIDGGKGQVGMALQVLKERGTSLPVIGLAKRREEIIIPAVQGSALHGWQTIRLPLTSPGLHLLERVRDEAHRFAIAYHRLLRRKQTLV